MKTIIINAATRQELDLLVRTVGAVPCEGIGYCSLHQALISGKQLLLAVTGIGKANTAAGLALLLEKYPPHLLINTGCAGAFPASGLSVGEIAIATAELYADEGVITPEGWQSLEAIGIPLLTKGSQRFFNEFPLSLQLAEKAAHLADAHGVRFQRGRFLTVSTVSGTDARGEELYHRFGAICETMEGAVAAHLAMLYGVDCMEIRGVSNLVQNRDRSTWNIPLAVEQVQRFIFRLLETI